MESRITVPLLPYDEVEIAYTDTGGSGIPLLCIPPLGHSRTLFELFAPYLKDRFRLLCIDPPGVGDSQSLPFGAYEIATETEVLEGFLTELGIEQALVLGISRGATVALTLALDYPDRVLGVVAQGAVIESADFSDWERKALGQVHRLMQSDSLRIRKAVRYGLSVGILSRFPKLAEAVPYLPPSAATVRHLRHTMDVAMRSIRRAPTEAFDGMLDDLLHNVCLTERLGDLAAPLLLLDGRGATGKAYVPINTFARISAAVPKELVTTGLLPGGHFAASSQPELFAQHIHTWANTLGLNED